jgi:hypothetical protein
MSVYEEQQFVEEVASGAADAHAGVQGRSSPFG